MIEIDEMKIELIDLDEMMMMSSYEIDRMYLLYELIQKSYT
jgi:hypothetical protein